MRVEKTHMDLVLSIDPTFLFNEKTDCQNCFEK